MVHISDEKARNIFQLGNVKFVFDIKIKLLKGKKYDLTIMKNRPGSPSMKSTL